MKECYNTTSVLCFGFFACLFVFLTAKHLSILAPQPGIRSAPPALEGKVLTTELPKLIDFKTVH